VATPRPPVVWLAEAPWQSVGEGRAAVGLRGQRGGVMRTAVSGVHRAQDDQREKYRRKEQPETSSRHLWKTPVAVSAGYSSTRSTPNNKEQAPYKHDRKICCTATPL